MAHVRDMAWDRENPSQLASEGVVAVCRYVSWDNTGKNLTLGEARGYADAGISVVTNWEYNPKSPLMGFQQGVAESALALSDHQNCGGPSNKPIYYSVDFDVPDFAPVFANNSDPGVARQKLGPIAGYFDGVASKHDGQPVGAYGGYWVIKRLFDAGLISYGWQTYAWSGGVWDSRAQLRQVQNGVVEFGHDVDIDESQVPDFGQWMPTGYIPVPAPPPPPPGPGHEPGTRLLQLQTPFLTGDDVRFVQRFIGPNKCGVADGEYGPHSVSGVRWYQSMRGITSDGIVGPVTWRNMGVAWHG